MICLSIGWFWLVFFVAIGFVIGAFIMGRHLGRIEERNLAIQLLTRPDAFGTVDAIDHQGRIVDYKFDPRKIPKHAPFNPKRYNKF